ncbi:MAG: chromosome segregation protein [Saprospiraceae bacterium]|jgi:chromosome segregation protein
MRLKSLEIKGFKSFANPTAIHFGEDVIGIVGPNGSGKSNVVDAIRWVLGEQKSKELRLDKMTSVIFNGTKKRKPAGVASVSLTFDNTKNILPTEYQSVKITRMLYRTGESEYRLNEVQCRLKDITNLFMDTGIGSNSYAIIALGMVDDILADKEDARRRMFEQAAGVSKYKRRKKETLSKLKNTTADLERVEDLLFEIDGQLKLLEKQAKRARKYFEMKDQYKWLSVQLANLKVSALKEQHKSVQSQLQKEEDIYRQSEVDVRQLEADLERERKANLDKEQALSNRQRELNSLVGGIRGMENDKRMLEQKKQFVEQNRSKLSRDIEVSTQRIGELEGEIESYRMNLNEEKRLEIELEKQLDDAEEGLANIKKNHGELKSDLDMVMQEQQRVERELFELEKNKAINANQIDTLKGDMQRGEADAKNRRAEMENLQGKVAEFKKQETEKLAEIEIAEAEQEKRAAAIEEAETKRDELQKEIQKVNRSLDSKRNEYKLTKSMVENLEGFPESIRFLSNKKNWKNNAPLLSDLIYVEQDFRVAIENYLEPYLNYYVVQTLEEAFEAIQLLSNAQKGKANFFVLDAFADYSEPMTMLAGTQKATDLIQTDEQYRKLISHLLENVLVTDNETISQNLPDDNMTVLSKTGRFVRRKFSIGGGSVGLFEGKKIGRKKNLEILEQEIKKGEKEETKLSTEFYNVKQKIDQFKAQNTREIIKQQRAALNRILQEKVSVAARLESFASYVQEADNKKTAGQGRVEELELANVQIEKELTTKLAMTQKAKEAISNTDGSFRQVAEALSKASTNFNEKNIEFIKQQNKVGSFQRELAYREKQLDEIKVTLETNNITIAQSVEEVGFLVEDIEKLEKLLLEMYEEKKEKAGVLTEAEQTYFKARGGANEIEDKIRKVNKVRQDAQILVNRLKDKLTDVRFKLQSVAERLKIEFSVNINDIEQLMKEMLDPENVEAAKTGEDSKEGEVMPEGIKIKRKITEMTENELQLKVEKLRGRLDNYGEINPMAVEAYDEMKERFENITTQRDDILKAKDDLLATIQEIEIKATGQFLEAFDKVRVYFIDIFRSLFSEEDNADLILLEPDNPLESKIEIVAKPKGKRPQSINQLSGGEKTLTATALLFALYLLKPAPFCIFDEVDAPLDDANIEKFNRIIKKFSKDSQFVIVTHNKQTMAAVDVIYGVYMQEQGVSAVAPVDFRDLLHTAELEAVS